MRIVKLIGPDCIRAKKAQGLLEAACRQGFYPLMCISPDNKSSFIIADYLPSMTVPTYEDLVQAAHDGQVTTVVVRAANQDAAIRDIIEVLSLSPNALGLNSYYKRQLFNGLDYLISVLMFNDKMPNVDLLLRSTPFQGTMLDVWKIQPFFKQANPTLAQLYSARLGAFLEANEVPYVNSPESNTLLLLDISRFAWALLRIAAHPTLTPLFGAQTAAALVLANTICPLTRREMQNPVIAPDGYTYEENAIKDWLTAGNTHSPVTGAPMPNLPLVPNYRLMFQTSLNPPATTTLFPPVVSPRGPRFTTDL